MKRFILVLVLFGTLITSAFAYTEGKEVKNVGIPNHVSHIEFWNGGTKIYEADNATVVILVQTNESILTLTAQGNKIQFYVYKITSDKGIYKIVDSEALAILYTE